MKDYSSIVGSENGSVVANKLNDIKINSASDIEKYEACKEFEQYMLEQIYKSMEKTIMRAEKKSDYENYFGDMMVQEYSKKAMDQGGIGLAKQLYESMKRNEGDL